MQWQFAALKTYLWVLDVFSVPNVVLVLCPGVQQTNHSICLKRKLVKGSGGDPVYLPKSDYTGSIVPFSRNNLFGPPLLASFGSVFSKQQNWWCSRLGFNPVGCSASQPWSSQAYDWLQCGSVTQFSQVHVNDWHQSSLSHKVRPLVRKPEPYIAWTMCLTAWWRRNSIPHISSLLVFYYTQYVISVDAPDFDAFPAHYFFCSLWLFVVHWHVGSNHRKCGDGPGEPTGKKSWHGGGSVLPSLWHG